MPLLLYDVRIFLGDQCDIAFALTAVAPTETEAIKRARATLAQVWPIFAEAKLLDGPGLARMVRHADSHDQRVAGLKIPPAKVSPSHL